MKITEKHFNLFKTEFTYWFDKFGMTEFTVNFHFGMKDNKYANASNVISYENSYIDVYFDKEFGSEYLNGELNEAIKEAAKHEAVHALTNRLFTLAKWRFATEEETIDANEQLVRKLVKLINCS